MESFTSVNAFAELAEDIYVRWYRQSSDRPALADELRERIIHIANQGRVLAGMPHGQTWFVVRLIDA